MAEATWLPSERTEFVIASFGGSVTRAAAALGVSKSQPSRWRSGKERPSVEVAQRLLDLDHVLARAQLLWSPAVAMDWMESPNGFLGNARPLDVLQAEGAGPVLEAIDAALGGGYA